MRTTLSRGVITAVVAALLLLGCGEREKPQTRYQIPEKSEGLKLGWVRMMEPKAFIDSLEAGADYRMYYIKDAQPESPEHEVHIPGMQTIPLSDSYYNLEGLPKDKPLLLICLYGDDSARLADAFSKMGYNCYFIVGGSYRLWKEMKEHGWKIKPSEP